MFTCFVAGIVIHLVMLGLAPNGSAESLISIPVLPGRSSDMRRSKNIQFLAQLNFFLPTVPNRLEHI